MKTLTTEPAKAEFPLSAGRTKMSNLGNHPQCWKRELQLTDCLEAYGPLHASTKCGTFMADFKECVVRSKQRERILIMRNERKRQVLDGERARSDRWSSKVPTMDTF